MHQQWPAGVRSRCAGNVCDSRATRRPKLASSISYSAMSNGATRAEMPEWRPAGFRRRQLGRACACDAPHRPVEATPPSANTRAIPHDIKLLASGSFVELFGYDRDDPPARFFLRDLAPSSLPPQGVWRRYDLGRVQLMPPHFSSSICPRAPSSSSPTANRSSKDSGEPVDHALHKHVLQPRPLRRPRGTAGMLPVGISARRTFPGTAHLCPRVGGKVPC